MEHPSLALSELAGGEITPLHPPPSQTGPALGKALPEGSTLEDPVGEKHLRMTLPKTLGLSSMDKGKPRRGGRDVAETQGDIPLLATKALQEPGTELPNFTCVWEQAQKRHPQSHP